MAESVEKARSMTGFGACEQTSLRGRARVEIRSVNHRFLEVHTSLPAFLNPREAELRALVTQRVRRARVDLLVAWQPIGEAQGRVTVDLALVRELHCELERLRDAIGLPGPVGLETLIRYPEVVHIGLADTAIDDASFAEIRGCVVAALDRLEEARRAEGRELVRDVERRLDQLAKLVEATGASASAEPARIAQRLRDRVSQLVEDFKLDPARLHQEVAYAAEKADVSEELTRLRTHIGRGRDLLRGDGEIGKPLDFLVQELSREVNTLGAKSRDPETSGMVLEMKAELEKIREQARNLE